MLSKEDVRFLNTFVTSFIVATKKIIEERAKIEIHTKNRDIAYTSTISRDVNGIIQLSGNLEGSVILSFHKIDAERYAELFANGRKKRGYRVLSCGIKQLCQSVIDKVDSKKSAEKDEQKITMNFLGILIKKNGINKSRSPRTIFSFESNLGDFALEFFINAIH